MTNDMGQVLTRISIGSPVRFDGKLKMVECPQSESPRIACRVCVCVCVRARARVCVRTYVGGEGQLSISIGLNGE